MKTATQSIVSLGQSAAYLQTGPARINAAATEIGVSPAMTINGVAYFAESDVERIGLHLRGLAAASPTQSVTREAQ